MQQSAIKPAPTDETTDLVRIDTCPNCENRYVVLWIKEGADWCDFGFRHCPFCGLAFDPVSNAVMV